MNVLNPFVNILLLLWGLLELYTLFTHRTPHTPSRDKASFFVIGITVALAFLLADTVNIWGKNANAPIATGWHIAGLLVFLGGVGLRFYSIRVLGRFFTPTVTFQPEQTLVQNGPYRYLRHPSYTGIWLAFSGIGLMMFGWLQCAALTIFPLLGLIYRIHVEEHVLTHELGSVYRDYASRTWRLIPYIY